ncbi:MAG: amidohydrolase [Chitinophagaceae bacterium]|nr:MAG: amidohydrolase [Chitinophagaceae bacterium]
MKAISTADLIKWRRYIHENAELSFKEENTSKYVEDILKGLGNIEIIKPAKTSIIGILKGAKPGKAVAFRADMDALPIKEETGLSFASKDENVSHACGHDAHTAMLLATATTLSKMKDQINGTVYFIFQHAEEQAPGGAIDIVKSGVLKNIEAFFGMHVLPNFPVGHVGILPTGAASTTSDEFTLSIIGKGSHGSMPHLGIDPIVIGAEIVNALQTIVSRNVVPGEMTVVTIGKFQSGNANNVIADKAELGATIRTTSDATRKLVESRIKTIVENLTKAHGATYELNYVHNYPAVQNDSALNIMVKKSAATAVGQANVFDAPMMTASEDFSYYNQVAPQCFLTLGVGNGVANHNPKFNIDEKALQNGVKTEVQIILDFLNR